MAKCNNKKCPLGECDQSETCTAYVPVITRADKIRAMSDEELAYLIRCGVCELIGATQDHCETNTCVDCVLDWLKQSAE